jgi:anti-sigma factor RsiW
MKAEGAAVDPALAQLIQPYLAGRLPPQLSERFEEALLESPELQDAVALHRAMREGLEAVGRVDAPAPEPPRVLERLRRWVLGV